MPDRIVRSNILTSDAVNGLSWAGEVFYRRLMSVADDYGRYDGRPEILRASLYSLKLDNVSKSDVVKWRTECSKAGLIRLYTIEGKEYLEILKFGQRLRAMKSKYPAPVDSCGHPPSSADRPPPESEEESEEETEENILSQPNGSDILSVYNDLKKKPLVEFIKDYKPDFIEPYVDLWNVFAKERSMACVQVINDTRKKKFKVRIKEPAFNFIDILGRAGKSEFLLTSGKWFGFDWIIENNLNYLKILEGNFDKKPAPDPAKNSSSTTSTFKNEFERTLEKQLQNNRD